MRIDLDWTADSRDPLFLRAPIAPALPVARDDVGAVLKGLDALGYYDAEAGGIPPRSASVVHDAIERFQADHGLARDGVMRPDGPTLRTLNRIFEARREEKFRDEQDAAAAARTAAGRLSPIVLTGQNNAVVGPHPAADPSGQAHDRTLLAQGRRGQARAGDDQLRASGRRMPQEGPFVVPPNPVLQDRVLDAIPGAQAYREPPSRLTAPRAQPPWPVLQYPHGQAIQVPGRDRYWATLQAMMRAPGPSHRIGPRLAEALQVFFDGEDGAQKTRSPNTAFAGLNSPTFERARERMDRTDPEVLRNVPNYPRHPGRPLLPSSLLPEQWALALRDHLDVVMSGVGVQGIEIIGDAAPLTGSRELAAAIVSNLLRANGETMKGNLQRAVNDFVGSLPDEARRQLPADALQRLPGTTVFGPATLRAIVALAQAGYSDRLRAEILRFAPSGHPYDRARNGWLQGLRFGG